LSVVALNGIGHYFGDQCILSGVSFSIDRQKQIGLIGRNGSGKTTLLDIVSDRMIPKEGTVNRMKNCRISYLSQSMQINSTLPLLKFVLVSYRHLNDLSQRIRELEEKIAADPSESNLKELGKNQEEFMALDGYSLEQRAKIVLQQLGFPEETWERTVNSFSGGEKTRIQLAAILLQPADLLLLDEPTNHLDLKMRNWLIKFLTELNIPYVIVSHDRHFLDKTTNVTFSIENRSIVSYSGSYSLFEKEYREKQILLQKQYQAQQDWIAETEFFIRKNIAGQKTKQAKSRLKSLERIKRIEPVKKGKEIKLSFEPEKRSGNIVYHFEEVGFGFPGKLLGKKINGNILYQDRIAILGDNGCGKTTFLQLLLGEKNPSAGQLQIGASLSIGYYDQLHLSLNDSLTVRETINSEHLHWTNHQTLSYLAKFGFTGDDNEKKVELLSGGEKARLYLSLLIARQPNVLIMDEPTNHLDIFLIESLEEALEEYQGTVIFVSHDRFFIDNTATRYWVFQNQRVVETKNWEELLLSPVEKPVKQQKQRINEKFKEKKTNPILLDMKLQEIENLRERIEDREKELHELEMQFLKKEILRNAEKTKLLHSQIDSLRQEIEKLTEEANTLEDDYLNSVYQ
jgi:ATP-binding cassette subfamily F protein 3